MRSAEAVWALNLCKVLRPESKVAQLLKTSIPIHSYMRIKSRSEWYKLRLRLTSTAQTRLLNCKRRSNGIIVEVDIAHDRLNHSIYKQNCSKFPLTCEKAHFSSSQILYQPAFQSHFLGHIIGNSPDSPRLISAALTCITCIIQLRARLVCV